VFLLMKDILSELLQCFGEFYHYIQGTHRCWKVMEFYIQIFQAWKVMENPRKAWKINQIVPAFYRPMYMFQPFSCIIIVFCQTHFDLLFSIIVNCVACFVFSLIDLVNVHGNLTCSISTRVNKHFRKDVENGCKWSCKVGKTHVTRSLNMLIGWYCI